MQSGQLHHVDDLERTVEFWGWLFPLLGWSERSSWPAGADWVHPAGTYIVFARTDSGVRGQKNDRQATGLNHLAFSAPRELRAAALAENLKDREAREDAPGDYLCFEDPNGFAVEIYFDEPDTG